MGERFEILAQSCEHVMVVNDYIEYGQLLEFYEFLDGSPCGKLEE